MWLLYLKNCVLACAVLSLSAGLVDIQQSSSYIRRERKKKGIYARVDFLLRRFVFFEQRVPQHLSCKSEYVTTM